MFYRFLGGVTFILFGIDALGVAIPGIVLGIFALLAGIALLVGY